jgi:hypothetical protein
VLCERLNIKTWSIISFPTYNNATGMAERSNRSMALTTVIQWLVSQTNLKKAGILRSAVSRSLKVILSGSAFIGGRVANRCLSYLVQGKFKKYMEALVLDKIL